MAAYFFIAICGNRGIRCGKKRVARLVRATKLRSVRGYKRPR